MELFVKNMVCNRCIMVVKQQLGALGIDYKGVELGQIKLNGPVSPEKVTALKAELNNAGFELVDDRKTSLVTQAKSAIIQFVHSDDDDAMNKKLSVLLAEKVGVDYNYLSALFSSTEGITIEKYVILQRIERAKELLAYNELTLNEISYKLGYSSVQHLSQQFKKVTGITPSQYKAKALEGRKPLDQVG